MVDRLQVSKLVVGGLLLAGCGRAPILVETGDETESTGTTAGAGTTGGSVEPGTSTGQQVDVDTATTDGDGTVDGTTAAVTDDTTGDTVGATDDTTVGATDDTTVGGTDDTTVGATDDTAGSSSGDVCGDVVCDPGEVCVAGVCFPPATTGGECYTAEGTWPDCIDGEDCGEGAGCLPTGVDGEGSCIYFPCADACDCPPPPSTGDALPACADIAGSGGPDGMPDCYLSCESGESCPDGQTCVGGLFCAHTNAEEAGPYEACDPPELECADDMLCVFGELGVNATCLPTGCVSEVECPAAPPGGTVACDDVVPSGSNECYLDCADGTTCPAGWECVGETACVQPLPGVPLPGFASCLPLDQCIAGEVCYSAPANGGAVNVNVCTIPGCVDVEECPDVPATGDAAAACGDIGGGNDTCYLDCSGGETCPTGMLCADGTYCAFDSSDPCVVAIQDPSFEFGQPNPFWNASSDPFGEVLPICTEATCGVNNALTGEAYLWFGGFGMAQSIAGVVQQNILIPAEAASLSLFVHIAEATTVDPEDDELRVIIDGSVELLITAADAALYPTYTEVLIDVSPYADDGIHNLVIDGVTAGDELTNFFVDDVSLICN